MFGWIAPQNIQAQETPEKAIPELSSDDEKLQIRERPTWRFEFSNDFMFSSDNQFTNGVTVQKHSTTSGNIDDLHGVRAFGKGLARRILP
jgi:hypothetical protein